MTLIRTLDLRGTELSSAAVNAAVPRAAIEISMAVDAIRPLLADVAERGEAALVEVALQRDGFDPRPIKVEAQELQDALAALAPGLRAAIQTSIDRVREVSIATLPNSVSVELAEGAHVHQRWQPVDSVGLYVPGGKAVYPSSVIMNVVPAQEAGVPRLAIATPGQKDFGGRPHPTVLATAALLGVEDVYCMGGPAAIAAFAYGLPTVGLESVNLVTGPGNIYVAAAKRALRGQIGIDSEAGTTEILVLADETADARLIAYDLISQAEHDEAAASVLVTDSQALAGFYGLTSTSDDFAAIPVTPEQRDALLFEQGRDKIIRVVDGQVVAIAPDGPRPDEQLRIVRSQRNRLLKGTDHIVSVPDFAISDQRRAELVAWRAALRDMPEAVDPYAPFESVQWPERPEWLSESFQIAPDVVHP